MGLVVVATVSGVRPPTLFDQSNGEYITFQRSELEITNKKHTPAISPNPIKKVLYDPSSPITSHHILPHQSYTKDCSASILQPNLNTPSSRSFTTIVTSTKLLWIRKEASLTVPDVVPGPRRVPVAIVEAVAEDKAEDFGGPVQSTIQHCPSTVLRAWCTRRRRHGAAGQ